MSVRKNIPNYITLGNLLCGSAATLGIATGGYDHPTVWLIFVAALLDLFDGAVARKLGVSGPMGRELDSLADVVSFGLAPTTIAFMLMTDNLSFDVFSDNVFNGKVILMPLLAFLLVLSAAWRLARFNIDESQAITFRGLPSPGNGLFWASLSVITIESGYPPSVLSPAIIAFLAILFAWLMVSPVRMFSFKFSHSSWKGNELRYAFVVAIPLVLLACGLFAGIWSLAVPVLLLLYILISVFVHFMNFKTR